MFVVSYEVMARTKIKKRLDAELKAISDFVLKLRRGECKASSEVTRDKGGTLLVVNTDVVPNE